MHSSKSSTRVHFLCLELGDLETLRAGWTRGPPRGQVSLGSEAEGCPPACRDHGQPRDGLTAPGHLTVTAGPISNVSLHPADKDPEAGLVSHPPRPQDWPQDLNAGPSL